MLTIKQITENTDAVLRGLEKKHFKNAKETIAQVLDFNDKRKANQTILDKNWQKPTHSPNPSDN
mgnify:CR=1 FL=1